MGGNALKNTSVRLTGRNYARMAQACVSKLQSLYPAGSVTSIQSYSSKESHGDLDILITTPNFDPFKAAKELDAVEIVRNGPVTSIGVVVRPELDALPGNVFQVDLISIDAPSFDYAKNYFAFNDLGNLIGRTAHAAGLSHKHNGLWFFVRDGDYKFREILLTRDYSEALEFLGYDAGRFASGFDSLTDIFQYVSGSKFFNRAIFLLENRNAKSRIRDRKRKTYMSFLEFCEENPGLPAFEYPADKAEWLLRIAEHFAHFQSELDQAYADLAQLRAVKAKFNGQWVSQLTGLTGKELGELMRRFKGSFESIQHLYRFILDNDHAALEARVRLIQVLGYLDNY